MSPRSVPKRPAAAPHRLLPQAATPHCCEAFATHLATRPPHTRDAYVRDVAQLGALAGETPLPQLTRAQLARFLATLHGRGLSGRSLARMLSAWRAFYRFVVDRGGARSDDPSAGLKAPKSRAGSCRPR